MSELQSHHYMTTEQWRAQGFPRPGTKSV